MAHFKKYFPLYGFEPADSLMSRVTSRPSCHATAHFVLLYANDFRLEQC